MDSISSEGNTHSSATSDATDLVTWSAPRLDAGAGVEADTGGFAYERRVIDDMEEDIVGSEAGFFWWGAIGNWFKTIDGKLSDAPRATLETPREGSHRATWIRGSANTAVLWAQLDHPQTRRLDLSEYVGFSFWARSGLPEAGLAVGLNLSDPAADGPQPSLPLSVSTEWRRFDVTFDELMSVTDVATIDFVMDVGAGDFDFWIDDLALLCAGPCPG